MRCLVQVLTAVALFALWLLVLWWTIHNFSP
jgi:hypothetical protein